MKLIGDLKKQVEQTASREGKRAAIAKAGMLLNDDELDQVSGGRVLCVPRDVRRLDETGRRKKACSDH